MKVKAFLSRLAGYALAAGIVAAAPAGAQTVGTRGSAFEYDVKGLLTAEIVEPGTPNLCLRTVHVPDEWGNRKKTTVQSCTGATGITPIASRVTEFTYSEHTVTILGVNVSVPDGMFAVTAKNPAGHTETRRFDPRFGSMVSVTGPNQLTTTFEYDDFGRKTLEVSPDGNRLVTRHCMLQGDTSANSAGCDLTPDHAPAGIVSYVETQPLNSAGAAIGPWTRKYADVLGRVVRELTQGFDGSSQPSTARYIARDTVYNEYGAAIRATQPYFVDSANDASVTVSGAAAHGWTATEYDAVGRPQTVYIKDAEGNETYLGQTVARASFSYNGLTTTESRVRTSKAGANQQPATTLTTTKLKNALGELVEVRDAYNNTLRMRYDAFGNQVETQDAHDNRVVTVYDTRGRKKELRDPNAGTWKYEYDALGQLRSQLSPTQSTSAATTITYDVLGRVLQRIEPEYTTDWTYDSCTKGIGKLCSVSTNNGQTKTFTFDSLGRPSTVTQSASTPMTATTTYTAEGRIASYTYPTGLKLFYTYTQLGYLTEIRRDNASTGQKIWTQRIANAWGKPESFDSDGDSSHRTTQTFDPVTGRINGIKVGTSMMEQTFGWDTVGNVTDRADKYDPATSKWLNENFAYDSLNRLASYDTTGTVTRVVTINYDAIGNIRAKSDVGTYHYPLSGSNSVRPSAVAVIESPPGYPRRDYTYDAAGNMTAATAGQYRTVNYTSFNLPKDLTGPNASYVWVYGADHERVRETRTSGANTRVTTYFHPDNAGGLAFEQEVTNGGTPVNRHYVAAMGRTVLMLETSGAFGSANVTTPTEQQYWHVDHLGSLVMIADHSRNVKNRFSYDPFGKRRYIGGIYEPDFALVHDTENWSSDRGFTGHEHLDDVGIVHMNGRTFDPLIGRFMQADPVIQFDDNGQSYNRFSYVLNNPLNATDPTGQFIPLIFAYAGYQMTAAIIINGIGVGVTTCGVMGLGGMMVAGAVGGVLAAAISGADMNGLARAALAGAAGAALFNAVGTAGDWHNVATSPGVNVTDWLAKSVAHAGAGCVQSAIAGGRCKDGALGAGAGAALGFVADSAGLEGAANLLARAAIGGAASAFGGESFSNGALTAAFGYLFNDNGETQHRAERSMDRQLQGLDPDRYIVSKGAVHGMYQIENAEGKRTWIEGKPDRVVIDTRQNVVHLAECKGGQCSKWTPAQREYMGAKVTNVLFFQNIGKAEVGGQYARALGLSIGQGALFAEEGSRTINSRLTKSAEANGRLRVFRSGRGGAFVP